MCVYVHIIYMYVHMERNIYKEQNYLIGRTINFNLSQIEVIQA